MKNKNYIPKGTNDIDVVEELKRLPFDAMFEDVTNLLKWLRDGHWEVAQG